MTKPRFKYPDGISDRDRGILVSLLKSYGNREKSIARLEHRISRAEHLLRLCKGVTEIKSDA